MRRRQPERPLNPPLLNPHLQNPQRRPRRKKLRQPRQPSLSRRKLLCPQKRQWQNRWQRASVRM